MGKRYGRNQKRRHIKNMRIMREELKNFILFPNIFNALISLSPDQIKTLMPTMSGLITETIFTQLINEIKELREDGNI